MKAFKTDGYIHLTNDNDKPLYCIHRKALATFVPDKLQQPVAIESLTRSSMCGDHCPFFEMNNSMGSGKIITISCSNQEVTFGIKEIIDNDNKPKSNLIV